MAWWRWELFQGIIVGTIEFDGGHPTTGLSINNTQPFYLTKNSKPEL